MLLMSWFLGHRAYGILAPRPGIKPAPSALEGEMLTTGPAGKSPSSFTEGFKMKNKRMYARASLVALWSRIHLPMQQTQLRSLIGEDPTCAEQLSR